MAALALSACGTSTVAVHLAPSAHARLIGITAPPAQRGGGVESSSCVPGPVCVAIGWHVRHHEADTWAARWRHGTWSQLAPPPHAGQAGLGQFTVACASTTWCMVSGSAQTARGSGRPYAAVLDGDRWTLHRTVRVKGATSFDLYRLDCVSPRWCMAVGSYVASRPHYPDAQFLVAEVWDGSTWHLVPIGSPRSNVRSIDPGFSPGGLHPTASPQQLSCPTSTFCMFAGLWIGAFIEQWDGSSWHQVPAPGEPGYPGSELSGGTCTSPTSCVTTGGYTIANGIWRPLVLRWNGTVWRRLALPSLPPHVAWPNGIALGHVTCLSRHACVAQGSGVTTHILGMAGSGSTWRYVFAGERADPLLSCLQGLCGSSP